MDVVFNNTVDKGIKVIGLTYEAVEEAIAAGRDLRGRVHGFLCPPGGSLSRRHPTDV
jgi:hypothetical protein